MHVTTEGEGRSGEVDDDGRFVIRGLFAGPCQLTATGQGSDDEPLRAKATVEAGGAVVLELRSSR